MIRWSVLVVVVASSMVTNAGGAMAATSAEARSHHAITTRQAAEQFKVDDSPFSTARSAYATAFSAWYAAKESTSETVPFVDSFVTACHTFDRKLGSQTWPMAERTDVHNFAASIAGVCNDVAALPAITTRLGGVALASKFASDSAASERDSNKLRKALGLPPLS